ncbi:hypothetical protein B0H11DRAFT_2242764 [Mycena galericulata]|nr:hypothetical protein B0H11DRAFT_2242764 [Mycena galericulata]
MALGLGLLYLDTSGTTIETLKAIKHPISKTTQIIVMVCAFSKMGDVLKVQAMLPHCDEHIVVKEEDEKKEEKKDEPAPAEGTKEEAKPEIKLDDTFLSFAVLAIALISMGEDIGAEMSIRQSNHLMHYGELVTRKSVPLAIGLVNISNPQIPILDTLSKYSHDLQAALNAILAKGLIGAGTNNARLVQILRQRTCTFGLNPFFSDRSIMSWPAIAGLLATLTAFTDVKHFILDKYHWMLYFLVTAMYPRFLITVDKELNCMPVTVRVGQALDVVGQAGKLRTISGFQMHQTPVRLATTECAELATEECLYTLTMHL